MATTAHPPLKELDATTFTDWLSKAEIVLGVALAAPFAPTGLVAAALTGFAGGLMGLYARVPGLRREGSLRPTRDGLAIAEDVWLLSIGLGLLTERLRQRSVDAV